ncbi:S1 RNA-binding domain-containing protein [Patescibacteria group bacterium]|nr:S1 RNA-binding domain-containing protein [Patescibacteria group bacterium]MBU1895952.1 S1 RNA-binding domain-containing protein [Patescibacteria group bacterium]
MTKKTEEQEEDQKPVNKFAELLKTYFTAIPNEGDLVTGTVVSVDNGVVRIDVNGVSTGIVRGQELFSESDQYSNINIGDEVEATVIERENETGEMELSFRSAGHQRVWDQMETYQKDGITIESKVLQANKGGLMMQVDALAGFLPVSQLSPDNYPRVPGGDKNRILEELKLLIGKTLQVKVIDANQKEEKIIVSEKAVWEDDQKAVLDSYKIGDTITGEVSALTSFGAFIKFGDGLEGLVHISEIVWQRIDHPRDVLKIGDKVKAQIIDLNKSKIYLSIKRLIEDPWKIVKDKYKVGEIVKGEVHKIEPFGLMVKLDDDIHGLAHISEVSNSPIHGVEDLKQLFTIGEKYKFEIVSIEPAEHRLGLKAEGVKGRAEEVENKKEKAESESVEKKEEDAKEQSDEIADEATKQQSDKDEKIEEETGNTKLETVGDTESEDEKPAEEKI